MENASLLHAFERISIRFDALLSIELPSAAERAELAQIEHSYYGLRAELSFRASQGDEAADDTLAAESAWLEDREAARG